MESIKHLLDRSEKLSPMLTGIKPYYEKNSNIKSVVFDIYGTLLISASGDIDKAEMTTSILKNTFNMLNIKLLQDTNTNEEAILSAILQKLVSTVKEDHEKSREDGVLYPEVDILKVWERVLKFAQENKFIEYEYKINISHLTFIFEFFSNPIYPMPAMKEVILQLNKKGIPLGIISNAQFYTPVILNYFINNYYSEDDIVSYFEPDLTVFSYKKLKSKPDESLFSEIIPVLDHKYDITPDEVLFVGNDILKDIYPAKQVGFRTALFAGDKRSYRIRSDNPELAGIKPDYLITDLEQILKIVD
jgi:putative hydrolase of the HAD superfamily